MTNHYAHFIKAQRMGKGVSQLEVAEKLGMSRVSYIALEQGKRDLTLSEAQVLANFFGISLRDIENATVSDYEKYKQMILQFLREGADSRGKVPKTKLAKLVYLADFAWFYKNLQSMSGMQYRKIQYGPVPDAYFRAIDELFEGGKINIESEDKGMRISITRSGEKDVLGLLNSGEKSLIKDIAHKWKDKRTQEIVAFTHGQLPYMICTENEIIPYGLITQEDPNDVY